VVNVELGCYSSYLVILWGWVGGDVPGVSHRMFIWNGANVCIGVIHGNNTRNGRR
jgi:hypothetical protein